MFYGIAEFDVVKPKLQYFKAVAGLILQDKNSSRCMTSSL